MSRVQQLQIIAEFDVCTHYLSALINDDYSALDDDDDKLLRDWIKENVPAYSTIDCDDDEPSFKRDDISGLMADCTGLTIWGYNK